jgi:Domain of unknown function (DUF4760)
MIEKVESTTFYRDNHRAFLDHRKKNSFADLHGRPYGQMDERHKVTDYLSHYEIVSMGIRSRILDERFYKNSMRSAFVRDWDAAADLIQRERWRKIDGKGAYNYKLYEHQCLAVRWGAKRNLSRASSAPPDETAVPELPQERRNQDPAMSQVSIDR